MINLAAAAAFLRELTEKHLDGATHGSDPAARGRRAAAPSRSTARAARRTGTSPAVSLDALAQPVRRPWLRRVASLVTQRSTEEQWPRRKSPTSAC